MPKDTTDSTLDRDPKHIEEVSRQAAQKEAAERYAQNMVNRSYITRKEEESSPIFNLQKEATGSKNTSSKPDLSNQTNYLQSTIKESATQISSDRVQIDQSQIDQYHKSWQDYWQKYYHEYYSDYYNKYFGEVKNTVDEHNEKTSQKLVEFYQDNRRLASQKERLENPEAIRRDILNRIVERGRSSTFWDKIRLHVRALTIATTAVFIFMFMQFNPIIVGAAKQYLGPSSSTSLPSIIEPSSSANINKTTTIIIPKIGVKAPVVLDEPSPYDAPVQKALENGVIRYWNTSSPGENGNVVILGHSSNNILNAGQYKYVFVNLKRLESDDIIYIDHQGVRYAYKVTDKQIVSPQEFSHIYPTDVPSLTLVTCDPPGANYNRLYVRAVQISPNPAKNVTPQAEVKESETTPETFPSAAPSIWERIF